MIRLVFNKKWGYCAKFPNGDILRGIWYGNKNPMQKSNYGKLMGKISHVQIMKITLSTAHRASKLISGVKSKDINMRGFK